MMERAEKEWIEEATALVARATEKNTLIMLRRFQDNNNHHDVVVANGNADQMKAMALALNGELTGDDGMSE